MTPMLEIQHSVDRVVLADVGAAYVVTSEGTLTVRPVGDAVYFAITRGGQAETFRAAERRQFSVVNGDIIELV